MVNQVLLRTVVRNTVPVPVGATAAGAIAMMLLAATPAQAVPGTPLPLVSACTGASLPPSRLTPLLTNLVTGIFTPLTAIPIVGPGLIGGVGGIVTNAVSGGPIGLDVQTIDPITGLTTGVLTPGTQCSQQAGAFTLATPRGITIGGNSIDGLGATGLNANAGEIGSIALGNGAATVPTAVNSIALGTGATATITGGVALGAGSIDKAATSTAGATIGGTAYSFAGATPASVVSVGAAGAERQIANVAAGQLSATSTDAVNGSQLFATNTAVNANTAAITTNTTNIAGNTTAITNLTTGINNGTVGLVQQTGGSPGTGAITVGAATGGTSLNVAGTDGNRVISGVAAGVAPTDAANVGQIGAATANAVQYDTAGGVRANSVTLAGSAAGPVTVTNVAPGALTATSSDAVNGAQLFATNAQVGTNTTNIANNTTAITNLNNGTAGLVQQATPASTVTVAAASGGTAVDFTGTGGTRTLSGVSAGVAPTDAVNVSQLGAVSAGVTTNTTAITNLTNNINNGTAGLVQQTGGSPGTGAITVGAATGGTSLNVAGTGGNRVISGVAAGVAPTDAANVGQIGAATANAVQYDTAGGVRANSVTLAGGAAGPVTVTNVAAGALTPTSSDAVNGSQLAATNTNVTNNTTAITNLAAGAAGPVQQTGAPNGLALVALGGTGAAPGAAQTLSNVAAGVAPTDAVNLGQTGGLIAASAAAAPIQYSNAAAPTTPTPGVVSNSTTLVGTAPGQSVALHNVTAGVVAAGSTDAVNGSQLAATNSAVATNTTNIAGNTTSITTLTTGINNGTVGLVQQTGGSPGTGQITVGGATGGTSVTIASAGGGNRTLTGVANGLAGNDAVNVAQVNGLTGNGLNNVQYDPAADGGRANTITLAGEAPGGVLITNVAPGALNGTSTNAVNGSQLYATNTMIATLNSGQAGAFQSNNAAAAPPPVATGANASAGGFGASATGAGGIALGNGATSTGVGSVALGQGSTDGGASRVVSVGGVGSERRITNVAPALNGTDAVNLSQLQTATNSFTTTTQGLQNQLNQTNFDLNQVRRRANGGTAGAMAVAGLPQAFEPGKSMIGGGFGYCADQVAFAIGVSSIVGERTVLKAGGSISGQGVGGFNAGIGYQF